MLFKNLFAVVASLVSVANTQKISAAKTVDNIDGVTTLSRDLQADAKAISVLNAFESGPRVIQGFSKIVSTATTAYNEMTGGSSKREADQAASIAGRIAVRQTTTYTVKEQDAVCNAFIEFVRVHQQLLSIFIGKHGLLELFGVAYQAAAVLRSVEGVVDEIAFTLIAEVPYCANRAQAAADMLDNTLGKSIKTYAGGLP